jgi:CRISPR type III-A-associated protein Csm2
MPDNPIRVEDAVRTVRGLPTLACWPADDLLRAAQGVAQELGRPQDTALETQTYKFLAAVRKVELHYDRTAPTRSETAAQGVEFDASLVRFLHPKLAMAVSRKRELRPFFEVLDAALPKVASREDLKWLVQFVEAVIAYHRFSAVSGSGQQRERRPPHDQRQRSNRR